MPVCSIEWGGMTIAEWDRHFQKVTRSNLLQHYPYAQAMRAVRNFGARHGLILLAGQPAGIVQIEELGLLRNAIHVLSLDRGPLWFTGFGSAADATSFFTEFNRQFPRRLARKRRILPELAFDPSTVSEISATGLDYQRRAPRYETIWMDISGGLPDLRKRLSGKWRNALAKAERGNFEVSVDWRAGTAAEFLTQYQSNKQDKQYNGPPVDILRGLIAFMAPRREVLVVNARRKGQTLASVLVLLHGQSATYQASWTTDDGRKLGCHNRLIWTAVEELKSRDISSFDLGGVNREAASGVTRFKTGLGGEIVQLCGRFH